MQYLYQQSGRSHTTTPEQLNTQINEGFADVDEMDQPAVSTTPEQDEHLTTVTPPIDPESEEEDEVMYTVHMKLCIIINNFTLLTTYTSG